MGVFEQASVGPCEPRQCQRFSAKNSSIKLCPHPHLPPRGEGVNAECPFLFRGMSAKLQKVGFFFTLPLAGEG